MTILVNPRPATVTLDNVSIITRSSVTAIPVLYVLIIRGSGCCSERAVSRPIMKIDAKVCMGVR